MSKEKDTTYRAILRSNPHKMVKLPREVIEELGWREVIIAKESDEDKIYKEI